MLIYMPRESRNKVVENVEVVMQVLRKRSLLDLPVFKATSPGDPYGAFAGKKRSVDRAYAFYRRKPSYLKPIVNPHALMEEEILAPTFRST